MIADAAISSEKQVAEGTQQGSLHAVRERGKTNRAFLLPHCLYSIVVFGGEFAIRDNSAQSAEQDRTESNHCWGLLSVYL